jgi:propionaldehyde dehydrogenase
LLDEQRIAAIVAQVLRELERSGQAGKVVPVSGPIFGTPDDAVKAARMAQASLAEMSLAERGKLVQAIREAGVANAERLGYMAYEETGMGRARDKVEKNRFAATLTRGVEDLVADSKRGDNGYRFTERLPFGVILSLTPVTNPTATVINHAIAMIAGGNAVVFSPHPRAQRCSQEAVRVVNDAIVSAGGPPNAVVTTATVSMEVAQALMAHPDVDLVVATGGPGLAKAALACGKKAIVGAAGNPPVLVDETADVARAAKSIFTGAVFENDLLCCGEKTIIAVEPVAEALKSELRKLGTYVMSQEEAARVTALVVKDGKMNPQYIGQDASKILQAAGIAAAGAELAIFETDPSHPLVRLEQLMPVVPFIRVPSFEAGLAVAKEVEQGLRHTAVLHTRDMCRAEVFARTMRTTLTVVNAPSVAALGVGGEGIFAHTIAGSTGEGICTARTFTREQNLVAVTL